MSTLVSILIPTYNRADYLRDAIRSALAQTHENLEVLILDDASPDHTPQVAAEFADDPRLRYIRHPKNLGIADNWRAGIEAATGEFFCILHDDDTFEPAFVDALLAPLMKDETLILTFCDHWVMDTQGNRLPSDSDGASRKYGRDRLAPGRVKDFGWTAFLDFSIAVGATLFRRSVVGPSLINSQAQGAIDGWLFYQCVKSGLGAFYVVSRLMNYRLHPGGMSGSQPVYMYEGHLLRCRIMLADAEMAPYRRAIRKQMAETLTNYGISLLTQGESCRAREALKEALRLQASLRGFLAYGLACCGKAGVLATTRLRASA
jgi:glycosyltransferase involved in cell wall biosynthesis